MAGFQVIMYGRFWVFTEGEHAFPTKSPRTASSNLSFLLFVREGGRAQPFSFRQAPEAIVGAQACKLCGTD